MANVPQTLSEATSINRPPLLAGENYRF